MKPIEARVRKVPIQKIDMVVKVTFTRGYRLRLWLGYKAIQFLAYVWDCNVEVKGMDDARRDSESGKNARDPN